MNFLQQFFFISTALLIYCSVALADVFTAMVELENLLTNEGATTLEIIESYIQSESDRLQKLQE